LYEKFAELLDKNNKTAYVVAKETGIAQSVLSDWKTGRSTPKFDKLLVLAKYFGVPVEYFAEEE
jgi:repressor LexA